MASRPLCRPRPPAFAPACPPAPAPLARPHAFPRPRRAPPPLFARPQGLFVLGLTGPLASGKSNLAARLAAAGLPVLDADAVVEALRADAAAILAALDAAGAPPAPADRAAILSGPPALRRAALRRAALVPGALAALEGHFHPRVRNAAESFLLRCRRQGAGAAVLEVPLLLESGYLGLCDFVLNTEASPFLLRQRRAKRARRLQDAPPASGAPAGPRLQEKLLARQQSGPGRRRALAHFPGTSVPTGQSRGAARRAAFAALPPKLRSRLRPPPGAPAACRCAACRPRPPLRTPRSPGPAALRFATSASAPLLMR